MKTAYRLLLLSALLLTSSCAQRPDLQPSNLERESRLAEQIVDGILDGDPVYLTTQAGHRFLSIETEADEPRGAVIVMHGRGYHPDWVNTTNPLRVGLVDHGWSTLSIQMPVLHKEAKYNEYVPVFHEAFPRIEAAIAYLKAQGIERIFIAAHSCSVHMVNAWMKVGRFTGVEAYIGIGMGATDYKQPMVDAWQFDKIDVPVLDIYGSEDYPAVHRKAAERLAGIRGTSERSRQIVIDGADHDFLDMGDELVEAVANWLDEL